MPESGVTGSGTDSGVPSGTAPAPRGFRIRGLQWWEISLVAEADALIFGETAWTEAYYWAVAAQPGTRLLVAEALTPVAEADAGSAANAELTAATLSGWIVMSAAGGEADVMTIATKESARGRGLGRALIASGIDWARERGARKVHLEVDERNTSALGLYESLGFEEFGRRPDYYPGSSAILMRLRGL